MSEPKFKVHDRVKIITSGRGCTPTTVGKIVTISELGRDYCNGSREPGYKIKEIDLQTNCKTGDFNGVIGESSFELVSRPKFSVGDKVKICGRSEDNGSGWCNVASEGYYQISGVANEEFIISGIIYHDRREEYFYGYKGGQVAEHALSPIYTIYKDPPSMYLECLVDKAYMVKGRVYKYLGKDESSYIVECNLTCGHYTVGSRLYIKPEELKPSTKEAYDAQLLPAEILFNGWNSKSRFKVGDRVIANKNRYLITCKGWRGVVIELCKDGRSVIVADVVDPSETYTVDSKYFDHDTSDAEPKEVTTTFNNPKTKNNVNKQQSNREEQRQGNREEPYKQISCKVPGSHLKISAGGRVRGVGLKSARVQISIGSNNRYNKQGSVSGQKKTGRGSASFPL